MIEFLRARRALAEGEYENIPLFAETTALATAQIDLKRLDESALLQKTAPAVSNSNTAPSVASFVEEAILCVLLTLCARGAPWEETLNRWTAAAARMQYPAILTTSINTIQQICSGTPLEMYQKYVAKTSLRFNQIIAGLQLAVHANSKPALAYIGLAALVIDVGFATNLMLSHEALATLTRTVWLARLSAPFELASPRLTVPAIKAACESDKKGRALAATILLAAGDAVVVTKLGTIQDQLRGLAAGTIKK